uniref:EGF-like domain-containing protein n=1 Tax=Caenorhabditis japonica TaxID=281687 RepID=A0A8R1HRB0_CAEJA
MAVRHVFLLLMALRTVSSGIVLSFPQARFPPLDYLPDDLTMPPCGVPKPTKPFYTTFHIGNSYNVTWITPTSSNSTYRIRLIDSDGLTVEQVPGMIAEGVNSQAIKLRSPCEQCMLLVEQVMANGKAFRSCADVNVVKGSVKEDEQCSQRGSLMNATCQCESGFTGNQCQHYAHCETNDDCLNGGVCVDQPNSLIKKRCFCSYRFFGQRCDRKFNSQNDHCFAYDELVAADLPLYGMFNPRCFQRHDLSAEDRVYSRRVDNEVEVIMDFSTKSWLYLGWRPTELSTSCRLFPILEDTRGRSNEMDEVARREFVAKPVMPKNNGYTELGLKSSLHPMDCVDVIMTSVRKGRLFISDFYSRDRSTPLEDYWYDGEMSLSAAYGTQVDDRTIVMFRRELREFEPTDHPLGPNEILVVWSKGDGQMGTAFQGSDRGVEKLRLAEVVNVTFEQPTPTNELAFGVKNVAHDRLEPITNIPTTFSSSSSSFSSSSTSKQTTPTPSSPSAPTRLFTSSLPTPPRPTTTSEPEDSSASSPSATRVFVLVLAIFVLFY